jgi:hypothetical protein
MKTILSHVKDRLRQYFSGRLIIVQIGAGVGAFAGRSLIAYGTRDMGTTVIVASSMAGSFVGYVALWIVGYWLAFREDYRKSGRQMSLDVFRLQLVEQLPNAGTVVALAITQGALIGGAGMEPVLATNLASWFGPQKAINFAAMAASNTLKRSWVDGSWSPRSAIGAAFRRLKGVCRRVVPTRGDKEHSVSATPHDHHRVVEEDKREFAQTPEPVAPR